MSVFGWLALGEPLLLIVCAVGGFVAVRRAVRHSGKRVARTLLERERRV